MSNLTTIAALPSGPGCASKLPPEVGESREISMEGHPIWGYLQNWYTVEEQQKWTAEYAEHCKRHQAIDLGPIGGEG